MHRRVLLFLLFTSIGVAAVREEMVPMRDGVRLATNIIVPEGPGPWPVILTRTPYGKDGAIAAVDGREQVYTDAGYARVVQDCRGRFKSEGKYRAFVDDMEDGYDTVEWIAKQPWSNGKVGMVGTSAMGITTNLAAMAGPPHLLAAFVALAHGSSYRYSSYPGGLFLQNLGEEWLRRQGVPPADVPRPIIRDYDETAAKLDIRNYYSKMTVPFYNVGGWYDIFLEGNIDNFVALQAQGAGNARGHEKLQMGAFGHRPLMGDLKYPSDAADHGESQKMRWFDYWLKGVDNGITKEPAVRYYVMGDTLDKSAPGNEWRTAASWPPASTATSYYFGDNHSLTVATPKTKNDKDSYAYDPKNPVPSVGGNNLMMDVGPMDQRTVSGRPDVLKFETQPLTDPVEVVGRLTAKLYVSTDAEDTDFMVKLVDVYPNGYEALVHDEGLRLRYVNGFDKPTHIEKGKIYPIQVDLWSTALVFNKGHKIAVHVTSSNSPRFEKHSNTWAPVKSYDDAVVAHNAVYHDARHPSQIVLPVTKVYHMQATQTSGN